MAKLAKLLVMIMIVASTTFTVVATNGPPASGEPPEKPEFTINATKQSPWLQVSAVPPGSECSSTRYRSAVEYDLLTPAKAVKSLAGALSSLPSTPRNVVLYAYPLSAFKEASNAKRLISAMATASDSAKQIAIFNKPKDPSEDKFVAIPIQWDDALVRCFETRANSSKTAGLNDIASLGTVITYANDVLPAKAADITSIPSTEATNQQSPTKTVKVHDLTKFKTLKDKWSSPEAYLAVEKPIAGLTGTRNIITTRSNWAIQARK